MINPMIKLISLLIFLSSCAQVTSLNLKRHQFGLVPTKIIWLQIAGFDEEHLALIKFDKDANYKTSFENSLCLGKTWDYNLFQLRPSAEDGFLSQLTNRENIKGTCSDFDNVPVWELLKLKNYKNVVLESQSTDKQSLLRSKTCNKDKFLENTAFLKMENRKSKIGKDFFHSSERMKLNDNKIYYDRSCVEGDCSDSFLKNAISAYQKYVKSGKNGLFILRDFTFMNAINTKDFKQAKEILTQLNALGNFFQDENEKNSDVLYLVTSAQTKNVDFPKSGKEWNEFISQNKYIYNRNSKLISPVFVSGARGENFCSVFRQSEVLERMFSGAKKQGLELIMLNPFRD